MGLQLQALNKSGIRTLKIFGIGWLET